MFFGGSLAPYKSNFLRSALAKHLELLNALQLNAAIELVTIVYRELDLKLLLGIDNIDAIFLRGALQCKRKSGRMSRRAPKHCRT